MFQYSKRGFNIKEVSSERNEGPMLETLDYTIRIGSTPTFLYFDLYLYSTYVGHYVYLTTMALVLPALNFEPSSAVSDIAIHDSNKTFLNVLKSSPFLVAVNCMAEEEEDVHSILGTAIYIPEEDLLGSIPNGITFFKDIPDNCVRKVDTATTVKDQSYYKNTAQFYKSIATETNLKASYERSFSLGFTLDATTKHVSGSNRSVSGTSLNLATKAYELQLIPNCLYETAVQQRVLDDFARFETKISKPHLKV